MLKFKGKAAVLTDADPSGTRSDYKVTIRWGDGQKSSGQIGKKSKNGKFKILGSHTYSHAGTFNVTITIDDSGGATVKTTTKIIIAPPAPKPHGDDLHEKQPRGNEGHEET